MNKEYHLLISKFNEYYTYPEPIDPLGCLDKCLAISEHQKHPDAPYYKKLKEIVNAYICQHTTDEVNVSKLHTFVMMKLLTTYAIY